MNKLPITVIIPVKNEELNLRNCLSKLNLFEEILVIDSFSTDNTAKIAKEFNCKLIKFEWNGKFPKKRNWTLRNVKIKNDWVLFLDADEYITDQFIHEISSKIHSTKYSGYWLNYNTIFLGKELKYGDKLRKLALFKKSCGEYEYIEEDQWSHLDMEIHEHPILKGKIGSFKSSIIHTDFKGLSHYIEKHNQYSNWEAHRFIELSKTTQEKLTFRQKIKYKLLNLGILPFCYFIGTYILKMGILDGKNGYYMAQLKKNYFFQIQLKIKELVAKK